MHYWCFVVLLLPVVIVCGTPPGVMIFRDLYCVAQSGVWDSVCDVATGTCRVAGEPSAFPCSSSAIRASVAEHARIRNELITLLRPPSAPMLAWIPIGYLEQIVDCATYTKFLSFQPAEHHKLCHWGESKFKTHLYKRALILALRLYANVPAVSWQNYIFRGIPVLTDYIDRDMERLMQPTRVVRAAVGSRLGFIPTGPTNRIWSYLGLTGPWYLSKLNRLYALSIAKDLIRFSDGEQETFARIYKEFITQISDSDEQILTQGILSWLFHTGTGPNILLRPPIEREILAKRMREFNAACPTDIPLHSLTAKIVEAYPLEDWV